jgi:Ca2+-binding RTX toxin-like protein
MEGNDTLSGGADADTLDGGDDNDRLEGGDGNDTQNENTLVSIGTLLAAEDLTALSIPGTPDNER